MKAYRDVEVYSSDYFFEAFTKDVVPVAVELSPTAESLTWFEHPENALYVFGPEDGDLGKPHSYHCHKFVQIPSKHCLNLSAAVYVVLYDRMTKSGEELQLDEERGFIADTDLDSLLEASYSTEGKNGK